MTDKQDSIVYGAPDICGSHATLKGHRIEVSNLVADLAYGHKEITPEDWIAIMKADWISPSEIMIALRYCSEKKCTTDKLTCCHCTLNPDEGNDPDDEPYNGWELARTILQRLENA